MLAHRILASRPMWLLLIIWASLWFGLGDSPLWDRDEPRNARCAIEMLERQDWVVPVFNGQLRTHKPILLYWLQMPAFYWLGQTDLAARLGSGLMGSLSVVALYLFCLRRGEAQLGFWAAASLATSLMFVVAGRAATPDACLIATSTLGILALILHWETGSTRLTRQAVIGYLSLGGAILAKGPVGLVLPMAVVGLWGWCQLPATPWPSADAAQPSLRRWFSLGLRGMQAGVARSLTVAHRYAVPAGMLIVLLVSLPWYAWVGWRTEGAWLHGFFIDHNLGRAMTSMEGHRGGWWFYPASSLVGLFPWSLLLIPIVQWGWKHRSSTPRAPLVQLGFLWFAVYVGLFSLARTKLPSYITPSYPGVALIIGGFLADWSANRWQLSRGWLTTGAIAFLLTGLAVGGGLAMAANQQQMSSLAFHALWGIVFLLAACALYFAAYHLPIQRHMPKVVLGTAVLFVAGIFGMASPKVAPYREDLSAILSERSHFDRQGNVHPTEWLSTRTIEPSWVYYLGTTIDEKSISPTLPPRHPDLELVAKHLRKETGRLIVRQEDVEEWRRRMQAEYSLSVAPAVTFHGFLKDDAIAVLERVEPSTLMPRTAQAPSNTVGN